MISRFSLFGGLVVTLGCSGSSSPSVAVPDDAKCSQSQFQPAGSDSVEVICLVPAAHSKAWLGAHKGK